MSTSRTARIVLAAITAWTAVGFMIGSIKAYAIDTATETQRKLSVKLSKKFTLRFPDGTTGVAWSPNGMSSTITVIGSAEHSWMKRL